MPAASVYGAVGRPSLSTLACPRPAGAVPPVGADGVRRFAVGGVAVQIWGGSVIFDSWAVGLSRLCRVAHARKDAVAPHRRTSLEGPLHNKMALLLALVRRNYIRKKLDYQSGRPDLNRRPLDPQNGGVRVCSAQERSAERAR